MPTPLLVPDLGTDRITLSLWHVAVGERVRLGERLVELLIPGAVVDLCAMAEGVLQSGLARPGDALHPGQTLATIAECG